MSAPANLAFASPSALKKLRQGGEPIGLHTVIAHIMVNWLTPDPTQNPQTAPPRTKAERRGGCPRRWATVVRRSACCPSVAAGTHLYHARAATRTAVEARVSDLRSDTNTTRTVAGADRWCLTSGQTPCDRHWASRPVVQWRPPGDGGTISSAAGTTLSRPVICFTGPGYGLS